MKQITWITEALGFGNIDACALAQQDAKSGKCAVIHACKDPCHRAHVGYKGNLPADHACYLAAQDDYNLYMNIIDPPLPLFKLESFTLFFHFIDQHLGKRPIVIHCNKGESRAPSLTLLVMAKRLRTLPDDSYQSARTEFEKSHDYKPGNGISAFLAEHWDYLGKDQGKHQEQ